MEILDEVVRWAYRSIGERCARVEVGQGLFDALCARTPPAEPDAAGPRTPRHTLLGLPIAVNTDLAPMAWRTFDRDERVVAQGSGIEDGADEVTRVQAAVDRATAEPGTTVHVEDAK